jgi:hypothetical protein
LYPGVTIVPNIEGDVGKGAASGHDLLGGFICIA